MTNATYRTLGWAALLLGTCALRADSTISYDWRFDSDATLASPQVTVGGNGSAQAQIAPGSFTEGWLAGNPVLGSAQGIWDLAMSGSITLTDALGLTGPTTQARTVTVRVTQFQGGGGIYDQTAVVTVPGGTLLGSSTAVVGLGTLGQWVVAETQWRVEAGVAVNYITIVGGSHGTLVDQVVVQSVPAGAQTPPQLSIRRVGVADSQIEVAWPASYSALVLEQTADLSNPNGWSDVQAPVQISGLTAYVTLDPLEGARFYRLKQP